MNFKSEIRGLGLSGSSFRKGFLIGWVDFCSRRYGQFDREGKIIFIDRMEELMERYKIFMKRFELSEDFSAQMTVEQLKTQLGQFGMTPQMMFDQMQQTLERMKAEIR